MVNSVMYTSKSIPQFTVMKKLPPQKSRNKYGLRGGVKERNHILLSRRSYMNVSVTMCEYINTNREKGTYTEAHKFSQTRIQ